MSTTTMTAGFELTREERDLIEMQLWRWAPDGDPVPFASPEEALATIEGMQRAYAMRQEIGWQRDDPRETFTTTVDLDALAELLHGAVAEAARCIAYEQDGMERAQAGDRDHWFITDDDHDFTLEHTLAVYAKEIDIAKREHRVAERLLERLARNPQGRAVERDLDALPRETAKDDVSTPTVVGLLDGGNSDTARQQERAAWAAVAAGVEIALTLVPPGHPERGEFVAMWAETRQAAGPHPPASARHR